MISDGANGFKILLIFFSVVALIFASLRINVRIRKSKNFGVDDCFLLAAATSFALYTAATLMSIEKGIGSIPDPSSPPILADALRFWFISEVFHVSTVTLLRLAFALHLRNMAKTSAQRWVLLVLMSITIVYNTGFFLLMLFQCAPVQYFWTGWVGEDGNSMEQSFVALISYGFAGVGAGTDWGLVLVSPWFFWEKDMNGRVKFCLRVLLVLGICAGAAALVRIPTTRALLTTDDFFLDCVPIAIGSILEAALGMMALSATTFKPLYLTWFAEKPKEAPVPLILGNMDEKRSLDSSSSSVTGAQVPPKTTTQRKVSEEKTAKAEQENGKV